MSLPADVVIIMPTFQGMRFLRRAIDSVKAQTNPAWKLFISDDGSTDGSFELASEFAAEDNRISVRRSPAEPGIFSNINPAIRDAGGTHNVILMQDDELKPDYIASVYNLLAEYAGVRAFWFGQDDIDGDDKIIRHGATRDRIEVIPPSSAGVFSALERGCFWTISGSCTERELLLERPFREDFSHAADYEWLLYQLEHQTMVYSERAVTRIRWHQNQASARHMKKALDLVDYGRIARKTLALTSLNFNASQKQKIQLRYRKAALLRAGSAIKNGRYRLFFRAAKLAIIGINHW